MTMSKGNHVLASTLEFQGNQKAYDRYCKKIFSNKQIIARLLKEYFDEYKDIPLNEIVKCLGNEGEECIENLNLEDETILGSQIRFDILFYADIPNSNEKQLINIEPQMNGSPRISINETSAVLL